MVAANRNWRFPSTAPNPIPPVNRLGERVRHYFTRHPEVSPEEFLLGAVGRELTLREGPDPSPGAASRPPLTEENIRVHVWLNERLAALHLERHGLWPKIRRFLFGNGLVRRLAPRSRAV